MYNGLSKKIVKNLMIAARGPQTLKCKAVHGHESNITWSPRARQEDRGTGAHNMGTCPLARLSWLSMLNHGFVIEAVHVHESSITWWPRPRQEDRGTGAHNMGTCPLARLSLLS